MRRGKGRKNDAAADFAEVITVNLEQMQKSPPDVRDALLLQVCPMMSEMVSTTSESKTSIKTGKMFLVATSQRMRSIIQSETNSMIIADVLMKLLVHVIGLNNADEVSQVIVAIIAAANTPNKVTDYFVDPLILFFQFPVYRTQFLMNGGFDTSWATFLVDDELVIVPVVFDQIGTYAEFFVDEKYEDQISSFLQTMSCSLTQLRPDRSKKCLDLIYQLCTANPSHILTKLNDFSFFRFLNHYAIENQEDPHVIPYFEKFILLSQISAHEVSSPLNCYLNIFSQPNCGTSLRQALVQGLVSLAQNMTQKTCPFEPIQIGQIAYSIPIDDLVSISCFSTFCCYLQTELGFPSVSLVPSLLQFCSFDLLENYNMTQYLQIFFNLGDEFTAFSPVFFEKMFNGLTPQQVAELFNRYQDLFHIFEKFFDVSVDETRKSLCGFAGSLQYIDNQQKARSVFINVVDEKRGYICVHGILESIKSADSPVLELLTTCMFKNHTVAKECITQKCFATVFCLYDGQLASSKDLLNFLAAVCMHRYIKELDEIVYMQLKDRAFVNEAEQSLLCLCFGVAIGTDVKGKTLCYPSILSHCQSYVLDNPYDIWLSSNVTLNLWLNAEQKKLNEFPPIIQVCREYIHPKYAQEIFKYPAIVQKVCDRGFVRVPMFEFPEGNLDTTFTLENTSQYKTLTFWISVDRFTENETKVLSLGHSYISLKDNALFLNEKHVKSLSCDTPYFIAIILDDAKENLLHVGNVVESFNVKEGIPSFVFGDTKESDMRWYIKGAIRLFEYALQNKELLALETSGPMSCDPGNESIILSPLTVNPLFEKRAYSPTHWNHRSVTIYSLLDYIDSVLRGVEAIVERATELAMEGQMTDSLHLIEAVCLLHHKKLTNISNTVFARMMSVYCNMFGKHLTTYAVDMILGGFVSSDDESIQWDAFYIFVSSHSLMLNADISVYLRSKFAEYAIRFPPNDNQRALMSEFLLSMLILPDYEPDSKLYTLIDAIVTDPKLIIMYLIASPDFTFSLVDYTHPYVFHQTEKTDSLVSLFCRVTITKFEDYFVFRVLPLEYTIQMIGHLFKCNVQLNKEELLDLCLTNCTSKECWQFALSAVTNTNELVNLEDFSLDVLDTSCYERMFRNVTVLSFVAARMDTSEFWYRLCRNLLRKMKTVAIPEYLGESKKFFFWVAALLSLGDPVNTITEFPLCPSLDSAEKIIPYAQSRGQVYPESKDALKSFELPNVEMKLRGKDVSNENLPESLRITETMEIKADMKVKQLLYIMTMSQPVEMYENWNAFLKELYSLFGVSDKTNNSQLNGLIAEYVAEIAFQFPEKANDICLTNVYIKPETAMNWHNHLVCEILAILLHGKEIRIPFIDFVCKRVLEGWDVHSFVMIYNSILSILSMTDKELDLPQSFYDFMILSSDIVSAENIEGLKSLMCQYKNLIYRDNIDYLILFIYRIKQKPEFSDVLDVFMELINQSEALKIKWKKQWPEGNPSDLLNPDFQETMDDHWQEYIESVTGRLEDNIAEMIQMRNNTMFVEMSEKFILKDVRNRTSARGACACWRYFVRRSLLVRSEYKMRQLEVKAGKMFPFDNIQSPQQAITILSDPVMPSRRLVQSPLSYKAPEFPAGTSDDVFAYRTSSIVEYVDLPEALESCLVSYSNRVPYIIERNKSLLRTRFVGSFIGVWPAQEYSLFNLVMNKGMKWKYECNCSLLYGVDMVDGALFMSDQKVYFLESGNVRDSSLFYVHSNENEVANRMYMQLMQGGIFGRCITYKAHFMVIWDFSELIACTKHYWIQKHTSLALNFVFGHNFVLNFTKDDYRQVKPIFMRKVQDFFATAPPQTTCLSPINTGRLLIKKLKESTTLWSNGLISNFFYLAIVNRFAERSYADLTQYPIFPWVLSEYVADTLPEVPTIETCRDLHKPMGQLGEERALRFDSIYQDSDPHYYYGTHYMHFGVVLHFLFRVDPFSIFFFNLHNGYDHPNRLFLNIKDAWFTASEHSAADVKELIPQFFKVPEVLENRAQLPLIVKQTAADLSNVVLPDWATNTRHYMEQQLKYLESKVATDGINAWVDLIFGVNSRGAGAEKTKNIFHPTCYPESAANNEDLDELEKLAIRDCVINFGQCSPQVFSKPHAPASYTEPCHLLTSIGDLVWQTLSSSAFEFPVVSAVVVEKDIVTARKGFIVLPSLETVKLNKYTTSASLSRDGFLLVEASTTGYVDISKLIYDKQGEYRSMKLVRHYVTPAALGACAISAEHFIAFVIHENHVLQFDIGTGYQLRSIELDFNPEHIAVDDEAALIWLCSENRICICSISGEILINTTTPYRMTCICASPLCEHIANRFAMTGTADGTVIFWSIHQKEMEVRPLHRVKISDDPVTLVTMNPTSTRAVAFTRNSIYDFEYMGSTARRLHFRYAGECANCRAAVNKAGQACKGCRRFLCSKCGKKKETGLKLHTHCQMCQDKKVME